MNILYHYCSNEAFYSIIKNRALPLSALSLSNDSMEGKLVTDIFIEIAKADKLNQEIIQRLQDSIATLEGFVDGLGFCLSEKGDLLSQWRGYANDAKGISIGFSKRYLEQLSKASVESIEESGFTLHRVKYERTEQETLIRPTYNEIKRLISKGAFKLPGRRLLLDSRTQEEIDKEDEEIKKTYLELPNTLFPLFTKFFLLKTKSFLEEREWRLISYLLKLGNDACSFHALPDKIIPYREFPLLELEEKSIVKVILGPKNNTPEYVVDTFLKQNNFKDVKVLRSSASYR